MSLERLLGERIHTPDILDCLANLSADEVFTPPKLANEMLDLLPAEVWQDPTLRWLDPACKSGVFLREAARRLMAGLAEAISDEVERREHIFKNMLYGIAITELTAQVSRRSLYYSKMADHEAAVVRFEDPAGNIVQRRSQHLFEHNRCVVCRAPSSIEGSEREGLENYAYTFIHEDEVFDMNFDVVIGNPPYQLKDEGHGASATPIYHLFVEKAFALRPRFVSLIIPARWYAGGKGLDDFRKRMLGERSLKVLVDYRNAGEVFPGVEIKGGICYFLWDREYEGDCEVRTVAQGEVVSAATRDLRQGEGVLIRSNEAISILEKVKAKGEPTLDSVVATRNPFGLVTTFQDYSPRSSRHKSVKLFLRGGEGWISPKAVLKNAEWVDKHKVLISMAYGAGEGYPHQILGKPFVASPGSACTETYLVAGVFDSAEEAENYAAYIRTRFLRFLVSLRKNTQHTKPSSFSFVPVIDMRRRWSELELYERYELTDDEVAHINAMIKEMNS